MEWRDEALVIGVRRLGEGDVILEVMTRDHGRHLGVVKGGRSKRLQPALQAGNSCTLVWRARIEDQLGAFVVEPTILRVARLMNASAALYGLSLLVSLIRLLPEREAHGAVYNTALMIADLLDDPDMAAPLLVRFELAILGELGFGLDLGMCAATGSTQSLVYVSPKSGRAVSASAGEPWRDRLLPLPAFLRDTESPGMPSTSDILDAFTLTGYFLNRHVYEPRGLAAPDARGAYLALIAKNPVSKA